MTLHDDATIERVAPCPRCGGAPREGLTHASMLNSEPGVRHPYICIECMLLETEEMRRRGRVLPFRDWACNEGRGARTPAAASALERLTRR